MCFRQLVWLLLVPLAVVALFLLASGAQGQLSGVIDLNTTPANLTVYGDDGADRSGRAVAAGDINGDTTDDLIIGAYWADPPGGTDAGETYVIYGGSSLLATIDLDSTSADVTVCGDEPGDQSGFALAAGDINGDTTDDLIIGAWGADPAGRYEAGKTYVVYGGASLPATIDLNNISADLTVYGDDGGDPLHEETGDRSGWGVAAGDINDDGTDDLIIGATCANPGGGTDAGETYVIYGGPSLPPTIDLDSTSADLTVHGDDAYDNSGWGVAAGDMNGDGIDDLMTSAWTADPGGRANGGETYVIYGGPSLPAIIDLDSTSAHLTVYGDDEGDASGNSLAAGDVNGDGTDDLFIGAYKADPTGGTTAGETYVIYGGSSLPPTIDLDSTSADVTVYGDDGGDFSGWGVAAGDINGDGIDDVTIGAYRADTPGGENAGETYVIYGGASLPATIDLDNTSAGLTVYGDDGDDFFGWGVAAGDINGDGTDDLIIGAYGANPAGGTDAGETYVIYGEEPPAPVGGIAELPGASHSSGPNYALLAGAIAAAFVALGAGAWYARRQWLR